MHIIHRVHHQAVICLLLRHKRGSKLLYLPCLSLHKRFPSTTLPLAARADRTPNSKTQNAESEGHNPRQPILLCSSNDPNS